jgi:hypothetical protein
MPIPSPLTRHSPAETTFATVQSSQDMEADDDHKTETKPSNIVDWDGEQDDSNPMNWTVGKKWRNVAVVVLMTLNTYVYKNSTPYASTTKNIATLSFAESLMAEQPFSCWLPQSLLADTDLH